MKNAVYVNPDKPDKKLDFYESRVLIPIIQHRILVGWQARSLDPDVKRFKYLFPEGMQKSRWLYNLDQALMYPDVLITEGVPNVWRIGDDSTALFGKVLHQPQMHLMKLIWGFDGLAVLCLDEDTYINDIDLAVADLLRASQAFPRGVSVLRLRGGDPAQHTRERMRQLKFLATKLATVDPANALAAVLDEEKVSGEIHEGEAPEPFVPDNRPPETAVQVVDFNNVPESEDADEYGTTEDDTGDDGDGSSG